jgi:hypothetical protein
MTEDELKEELDRICIDELDEKTKKEIILNGFHNCDDENCPFCTRKM